MTDVITLGVLGFFLGMRHATDPDHVIAVSTIVSHQRSIGGAALIGILWGIGHTMTIVVVGGAIVVFGLVIPRRLGLTMELGVALMLIVLGLINLRGMRCWIRSQLADGAGIHSHPHSHGDYVHTHPHGHEPASHGHGDNQTPQARLDRTFGRLGLYQALRPVVVGLVHGMAGSAAIALLVLGTIREPAWALAYLLIFGLGTIVGMMLITATIALPVASVGPRFSRLHRSLGLATGLVSLALGLFLIYQIGFVDGLFTGEPRWNPE